MRSAAAETEQNLLQFLARIETANTVAAVLMVLCLLGACYLIDRNYRQLVSVQRELEERNQQGRAALQLLSESNGKTEEHLALLRLTMRRMEAPPPVPAPAPR
jgi:hypothetical protein